MPFRELRESLQSVSKIVSRKVNKESNAIKKYMGFIWIEFFGQIIEGVLGASALKTLNSHAFKKVEKLSDSAGIRNECAERRTHCVSMGYPILIKAN